MKKTTAESPPLHGARKAIFYGWYIVLVAWVSNLLAGTGFYIFNAFIEPLCAARGWTRAEINIAPMLGYMVNICGVLFYGTMVYRVGPRILMTIASLVAASAFVLMGYCTNILFFYAAFMLLFLGIGGMSGIVTATAVNNWFVRKRGRALGIATSGLSFAGFILPSIAMAIIGKSGLLSAFLWIALMIGTAGPLSWLVIRRRPEDMGLLPDGDAISAGTVARDASTGTEHLPHQGMHPSYWTFSMAIHSPAFWKIGLAYGLCMASVLGVMFQLKPRFSDVGFDDKTAMRLMAATAFMAVVGKYMWARFCDSFNVRKVVTTLLALNAAGLSLLLVPQSMTAAIVFVVVYGFSMGGVVSTQAVMIAESFGREAFPTIARYIWVVVGINFIGYPIMGASFQMTGSYDAAYVIFIVFNICAVCLITLLKKDGGQVG
ncbi:MAG: L-lactate transporter [Syntrophus sp. SKADARSKE-3]|nr:L-lactate transporter [Syntrophus sp. SKADARSKE-3]